MERPRFDTLIMDLGDVLVNYSLQASTAVTLKISLKRVLRSPTWAKYECGRISESDCYAAVANDLGNSTNASQVGVAISEARRSMQVNEDMIRVIGELKAENGLRVFVMSNIPKSDFAAVKAMSSSWGIFDGMFPSYAAGLHKPDLAFYRHVLEETNTDPLKAIFVDDKVENVMVARSFGLTGIIYKNNVNTARALTETYPDDQDTTSVALMTLNVDLEVARSVMDEMLLNSNSDGLVQVYFDKNRPRVDPVVCVNVQRLFFRYGRESQLQQTLDWIMNVLIHRAYIDGTRFYYHAESFLYFLSRLFEENPGVQSRFREPLEQRLRERIGTSGDALSLAMRALACQMLGVDSAVDVRALLSLQCNDGGWEAGWVCRMGSSGTRVGNRGVTTALAIKAIQGA